MSPEILQNYAFHILQKGSKKQVIPIRGTQEPCAQCNHTTGKKPLQSVHMALASSSTKPEHK